MVGVVIDCAITDTKHGRHRIPPPILLRTPLSRRSSPLRTDYLPSRITHIPSLTRPNPRPPTIRKSLLHHKILQTLLRVPLPQFASPTLTCRKLNSEFLSFELRTGAFSAFIDRLTPTTQIMIVIADPTIGIFPLFVSGRWERGFFGERLMVESAATMMNLAVARKHFEKLERWEITDRNGVKGKA